jgi:hypothetical protein
MLAGKQKYWKQQSILGPNTYGSSIHEDKLSNGHSLSMKKKDTR